MYRTYLLYITEHSNDDIIIVFGPFLTTELVGYRIIMRCSNKSHHQQLVQKQ